MIGRLPLLGRLRRPVGWDDEPGDPLPRRLERLAADATPRDRAAIARAAEVAQAAFVTAARDGRIGVSAAAPRAALPAPRRLPAGLAAALAVIVLLVGLGSVATVRAGPGQPLYALRVALEAVLLPADPLARLGAQLDRLDARLAEASHAADDDDWSAAADAFRAYAAIAGDATGIGGDDPALDRAHAQLGELERLRARPGSGSAGPDLDAATAACAALIAALGGPDEEPPPTAAPSGTPRPTPAGTPAGSQGGGSSSSAGPGGSGDPARTSGPGPGGQASPSPGPAATGGPDGSAAATPRPGGGGGPTSSTAPGGPGGGGSPGAGSSPRSGSGGGNGR